MGSMLLNAFEKALMNNPVRAASQRWIEAPRLRSMGGPVPGGHVLEVGCGRGVGAEIILRSFGAAHVDAFDLDPRMVELARQRLRRHGDRVRIWQGDASRIDAEDGAYDAVFDFGIIHHVPDWTGALGEIHRVLRPGACLYAEEVYERFIAHPLARGLFRHPQQGRFDHARFVEAVRASGLEPVAETQLMGLFGWLVARRPATPESCAQM